MTSKPTDIAGELLSRHSGINNATSSSLEICLILRCSIDEVLNRRIA